MSRHMTRRQWLMGAGAGTLLLVGGLTAGPLVSLAQGDDVQADLSKDEAAQIAIERFPGTTASSVNLETEDGQPIYDVNLSNGTEVEVNGNTGAIGEIEQSDGAGDDDANEADDANDDENENENGDTADDDANEGDTEEQEAAVPAGTLDDGADLLPQATITLEQAISAAQEAADGDVGEVDLEYAGDTLVFNVDIGDHDVKVNAADGSIVATDSDD